MSRSTLPLFPSDEGWPYPDVVGVDMAADDELDLDALELRADPRAFDSLTLPERSAPVRTSGSSGAHRDPDESSAPSSAGTRRGGAPAPRAGDRQSAHSPDDVVTAWPDGLADSIRYVAAGCTATTTSPIAWLAPC